MNRCPHCAAPNPGEPACRVCGGKVAEAPAPVPKIEALETTRLAGAQDARAAPPVPRLEGLETTEEVLGNTRIPDDDDATVVDVRRCVACGVPNPAERTMCIGCGVRL